VHLMKLSNSRASLLPAAEEAAIAVEVAAAVKAMTENEEAGGGGSTESMPLQDTATTVITAADTATSVKSGINDKQEMKHHAAPTVLESDVGNGSDSWRAALMALRSEFPVYPSQQTGGLSSTAGSGVIWDTQQEVRIQLYFYVFPPCTNGS
jgi:hypothetical protein